MTRINFHDVHAAFLGFVRQKAMKLREAPTIQTSFGISLLSGTPSHLRGTANVGQVLKDSRCAGSGMVHNATTQYTS